jgi:hypothetical protein
MLTKDNGHEVRRFFKPPLMRNTSGYDVVAAQTVQARESCEHGDMRFGHRYVDVPDATVVAESGSTTAGSMTRMKPNH